MYIYLPFCLYSENLVINKERESPSTSSHDPLPSPSLRPHGTPPFYRHGAGNPGSPYEIEKASVREHIYDRGFVVNFHCIRAVEFYDCLYISPVFLVVTLFMVYLCVSVCKVCGFFLNLNLLDAKVHYAECVTRWRYLHVNLI